MIYFQNNFDMDNMLIVVSFFLSVFFFFFSFYIWIILIEYKFTRFVRLMS